MAAAKPVRAMTPDRLKIFSGNANPALAHEICAVAGDGTRQADDPDVLRWRSVSAVSGERARRRRFPDPADLRAGRPPPDGTAADDRRGQAGLSGPHHRGVTLLWIRPAGSQGQTARPHLGEVGRVAAGTRPAPTASWRWICTPRRFRASSMFRWTTCFRRR